jgi:hypothetical protein
LFSPISKARRETNSDLFRRVEKLKIISNFKKSGFKCQYQDAGKDQHEQDYALVFPPFPDVFEPIFEFEPVQLGKSVTNPARNISDDGHNRQNDDIGNHDFNYPRRFSNASHQKKFNSS